MPTSDYSKEEIEEAKALVNAGKVGFIEFSEGTYQVEVKDLRTKKTFWPFLQLDDQGHVLDGFCNCSVAEKKKTCPHLAAAFLKIFAGKSLPIHVRFRESLWNQLAQIACRRHGSDPSLLRSIEKRFEAVSATDKKLFSVEAKSREGKKQLEEYLFHRKNQTEETSLKFSNLPPEEIKLWKEGKPSQHLVYELSFWSDFAKWWMQLQDNEEAYQITFSEEKLPKWIHVEFPDVFFSFYIAEANWHQIIPSLGTVQSPLPVHEMLNQRIESIHYDQVRHCLLIELMDLKKGEGNEPPSSGEKIELGEWILIPKRGFFPSRFDPVFNDREIFADKIPSVLHKHAGMIQKYLKDTPIHSGSYQAKYQVHFDADNQLHISCYVFEKGDLQKLASHCYGSWVFLEGKGFYLLDDLLFEGAEKIIKRDQVSDFVNRHRVWLNEYEGFQTHVSSIESQLTFSVTREGSLQFESGLEIGTEGGEFVDFGEWIYLKGKGFFAKRVGAAGASIRFGMTISRSDINTFIRLHREELEGIKGFFSSICPLEKCGLDVSLNEEKRIVVRPRFQFLPVYRNRSVLVFGDYTYVDGEGFAEIPYEMRLPGAYVREKMISLTEEPYFVAYELESLSPYITSIQRELQKGRELFVRVKRIQSISKAQGKEWVLELCYESEMGTVDAFSLWEGLQNNKRYLFTAAGLIVLKHARFNWLKGVHKKKWLKGGKVLKMTTLDLLRLSVFDDLRPPRDTDPGAAQTRSYLEELTSFRKDIPIDLSGFTSDLRSYQEVGVKWLWFLYHHGLSGLLCDEMGLGKTHQAMGLIAAARNQERGKRYLVVCPTSVIYHWQELLKRFLPQLQVFFFYGVGRKLEAFVEPYEVLLTSYGTMRSEKKELAKIEFDIAIFDEVQTAKNVHSQTHQAMKMMKARMRLGLTGTPIENRLLELKALFDVVVPGYMPNDAHFKQLFVNPIEKNQDLEKKVLLTRLIKPFMLRRKKSEVLLELPEKIEEIAYCDLSEEQRELYRSVYFKQKESLLQELEDRAKPVPYLHVFALLSTLKQICDHPCLITKKLEDFEKHRSGKWDLFVELLQEIRDSGQKLVVFSQYLDMLTMIEQYLKDHKIGYCSIRGSTRDRKAQLDRFRDDPSAEVFVASLQAVGVGVDLVSASVVIHYDRWWNPARENQATDRVHRIGQNRGVQVFKLVTKGTVEEHIHRLIEKKNALLEGIVGYDDQDQLKGLDRQELLELLWLIDQDLSGII